LRSPANAPGRCGRRLGVGVGCVAAALLSAVAGAQSPLIFPERQMPLRFDHARHHALGARCETCHAAATSSLSAADNLIPGEAACRSCHAIDRKDPLRVVPAGAAPARCDACHPGWTGTANRGAAGEGGVPAGGGGAFEPPRVVVPRSNIKFSHQLHGARGIPCQRCHPDVTNVGLATRADLPREPLCLECHDGKQAPSRCASCHLTLPDGRLRTDFTACGPGADCPPGPSRGMLVPVAGTRGLAAHTPSFRADHRAAGRNERGCLTCHKRSECLDCHGGVLRPAGIHPADYLTLHAIDARRNTPDCSSCHRRQTFCVGCHQRTGVASDAEGGQRGVRSNNPFGTGTGLKRFHPPGWVGDSSGAMPPSMAATSGHAREARRNVTTCASCHREQTCLDCHSADPLRGSGINPHGSGAPFAGSTKCKALASRNLRACLKCHRPGAPELDCK